MTLPIPLAYNPALYGCTEPGCGTQDTATADGVHGRRCTAHPPTFDAARAVELARRGFLGAALAACRVTFPMEAS